MGKEQDNLRPDAVAEQAEAAAAGETEKTVDETEAGSTASAEGSESSKLTLEDALARIAALEAETEEAKAQALRFQAEAQNAARRAKQDVEKAHKFGLEKFVGDLLPVVDNLERAIDATEGAEDMKAVTEGVELTLKSFVDTLKRHNVESLDPAGQPFDPQYHQAMTIVENPEVEPNTVINVFQKGYTLHGRLVRPAMVVVAKAPASQNA
ncbi:MAG: nucleotide exchange factor GrpE [Exilibacterium sp.]